MTQRSADNRPIQWRDRLRHRSMSLAADPSVPTRVVAFVAGVFMLIEHLSGNVFTLTKRQVEAATGMARKSWPLAEADPWVHLVSTGSEHLGDSSRWMVPIGPTVRERISASIEHTTATTATGGYVLDMQKTTVSCCGAYRHHPADDLWALPERGYDHVWWRWSVVTGLVDAPVSVKALMAMDASMTVDQAKKALVRGRAMRFVYEGVWMGSWLGDGAVFREGLGKVNARNAREWAEQDAYRLLTDRHAQLDLLLERMQGENLALALERGSECAITWAKSMGDPELRRAFAYGRKPAPVTMNEGLAARLVSVR